MLRRKNSLQPYHLTYTEYFSQVGWVIDQEFWVVILMLKKPIKSQDVLVIVHLNKYVGCVLWPFLTPVNYSMANPIDIYIYMHDL